MWQSSSSMERSIPEFGVAQPGCSYQLRPGAYVVLYDDDGRIAVVRTPGGCFLPGGGQESGESPEQALKRETIEECGLEIQVGRRIGVADQLVSSREEDGFFRKRGVFFEARRLNSKIAPPIERDHRLLWLPVSEALLRISHESHRWAIRALIGEPTPGTPAWYAQVAEEIIEPERRISDPHHHLWSGKRYPDYLLKDLWRDTQSGHKIEKTVFIECRAGYRSTGPEHLKPVGETEFVAELAAQSARANPRKAMIAGIVSHADLTLGDKLGEVLEAHEAAGRGFFRGIRHAGARHPHPEEAFIPGKYPEGLFLDNAFQAGVRLLGRRGYTYESWHYHFQLRDFCSLAKAAPETTIILDHFGTPLGTKSFRDQRDAIFEQWKADIFELAKCHNVYAKLGGLAMPDTGFGWHEAAKPASSDELVAAQKPYYLHAIESLGVERCMFESNFPVDKVSISYAVLWNAFKKMVADFSGDEKHELFYGTAARIYRL